MAALQVAEFVDRAVNIAIDVKKKSGGKLKDFREALAKEVRPDVLWLHNTLYITRRSSVYSAAPAPACSRKAESVTGSL